MRRYGITERDGATMTMLATVTGRLPDGRKVWTECNEHEELINEDWRYILQTRGGWSEFVLVEVALTRR